MPSSVSATFFSLGALGRGCRHSPEELSLFSRRRTGDALKGGADPSRSPGRAIGREGVLSAALRIGS